MDDVTGGTSGEGRDVAGAEGGKPLLVLLVSGVVLAADLLTKAWIQSRFHLGESVHVLGEWVRLTYVLNPGAAFGLHVGPYSRQLFAVLALVAVAVIVLVMARTPSAERARLAALALVLGGAVGNLLDRLRATGAVVDFLDVGLGTYRWPVFNVADMGVSIGAMLLVLLLWGEEPVEMPALAAGEPPGSAEAVR